ncbi:MULTISPECIES: hypothetical protein [unclassified Mycolicibacterium]|uniref:DUF7159 family protein n=1 Tax=unclassified Mycolicibacterium TaxID=2636767 RepID=UPI0012DF1BBA|nr:MULTISPECIES: hypothetical protein [unclassified Mycolicibacterium]MUL82066.1 hypothetical protein [Mycolicibacterium sp. CBMA 329]MUL87832.1 hypothetical protein [Mycolicibacterium sp. CBMA 331]MUM01656.1 hypothetical protein [Mycolicibacterium sp. CBMA 334]MUM25512.1 hypothetical protein [Mycolicibacterium sp. CBMA 295]MUM38129.1 hypothetical protein [Mycolicibacterium sp. CBMA 247]
MDVVIGIAMTSRDARLLLVEGTRGDGAVIDHDPLDADTRIGIEHPGLHEHVVDAVLDTHATAPANGYTVARVALTSTDAVADEAKHVLDALGEQDITNVVVASSADALEAAAEYTVQIADCDSVALCVVEPEETMLAVIGAEGEDGSRRLRSRRLNEPDAATAVLALRGLCDSFPESVAEVAIAGSAPDAESLVEEVNSVMPRPVVLGDDAALLLARGALLASAGIRGAPEGKRDPLMRTLAMVMATALLIVAGSVFLAVTVKGGHDSAPPQASPPAPHAAPAEPPIHTVVRKVVPLAGRAAQKTLVAPGADSAVVPLPGVIRR